MRNYSVEMVIGPLRVMVKSSTEHQFLTYGYTIWRRWTGPDVYCYDPS